METLVIDRGTPLDTLFSFVGADRIKISKGGTWTLPATDTNEDDEASRAARRAEMRAAFDAIPIDLTGFKFNRDEANDYD